MAEKQKRTRVIVQKNNSEGPNERRSTRSFDDTRKSKDSDRKSRPYKDTSKYSSNDRKSSYTSSEGLSYDKPKSTSRYSSDSSYGTDARKKQFSGSSDSRKSRPYKDTSKYSSNDNKSSYASSEGRSYDKPKSTSRYSSDSSHGTDARKKQFSDSSDSRKSRPYKDSSKYSSNDRKSSYASSEGRSYDKPKSTSRSNDSYKSKDSRNNRYSDTSDYRKPRSYNIDSEESWSKPRNAQFNTEGSVEKPVITTEKKESDLIRLNKFIANAGVCARREADELIASGVITVNGKVVTEMGHKVKPTDTVLMNGKVLESQKKVYILLNKPKDCITTKEDPEGRRTVFDYIAGACSENVEPVGRLDRNTTGILLFTNDGDLAEKILHPRYNKMKIYHAFLDKSLKLEDFQAIAEGVELEDGFVEVDDLQYVNADDKSQIGIQIHSGKNHVVKRIFETYGYTVEKLDRVYFAGLTKKNLPRGKWRFLTRAEVAIIQQGAYE